MKDKHIKILWILTLLNIVNKGEHSQLQSAYLQSPGRLWSKISYKLALHTSGTRRWYGTANMFTEDKSSLTHLIVCLAVWPCKDQWMLHVLASAVGFGLLITKLVRQWLGKWKLEAGKQTWQVSLVTVVITGAKFSQLSENTRNPHSEISTETNAV